LKMERERQRDRIANTVSSKEDAAKSIKTLNVQHFELSNRRLGLRDDDTLFKFRCGNVR
jgi:hypothetical protein